jgi:hypothetical protein
MIFDASRSKYEVVHVTQGPVLLRLPYSLLDSYLSGPKDIMRFPAFFARRPFMKILDTHQHFFYATVALLLESRSLHAYFLCLVQSVGYMRVLFHTCIVHGVLSRRCVMSSFHHAT